MYFAPRDTDGPSGTAHLTARRIAYAYPEGVPGMFQSKFAPADYMETVNTQGLPFYAKMETMPFNKGVIGEAQSNPIHFNSLPEAVIKLSTAAS